MSLPERSNSEKYGSAPQPTRRLPSSVVWALPCEAASSRDQLGHFTFLGLAVAGAGRAGCDDAEAIPVFALSPVIAADTATGLVPDPASGEHGALCP